MAQHFPCPQAFQALGDSLVYLAGEREPAKTWGFISMEDLPLPKSKHKRALYLPTPPVWHDGFNSRDQWQEKKQTSTQIQQNSWQATYFHPAAIYVPPPAFYLFGGTQGGASIPTALVTKLWEHTCSTASACGVWGLLAQQTPVCVTMKKQEASWLIASEGIRLFSSKQEIRFY